MHLDKFERDWPAAASPRLGSNENPPLAQVTSSPYIIRLGLGVFLQAAFIIFGKRMG